MNIYTRSRHFLTLNKIEISKQRAKELLKNNCFVKTSF